MLSTAVESTGLRTPQDRRPRRGGWNAEEKAGKEEKGGDDGGAQLRPPRGATKRGPQPPPGTQPSSNEPPAAARSSQAQRSRNGRSRERREVTRALGEGLSRCYSATRSEPFGSRPAAPRGEEENPSAAAPNCTASERGHPADFWRAQ